MTTEENPTAGDSGASITDRLESFLTAGNDPEPKVPEAQVPDPASAVPDEATGDDPEQAEQPQLSTTDLAKVLGIDESALDVDSDGNVSIKTKIDGKEGAAKFADLLKNYQLSGHAENKVREATAKEQALQAREQEAEQQFRGKLDHAEQLATIASQELMAEYQAYDWKALDQHPDQGAVAALKLKFQERQGKLRQAFEGIQSHRAQMGEQAKARNEQRLAAETEKLPTLIPEWKDKAVAAKEAGELKDWMLKVGYSAKVIENLQNSTALDVKTFRDAMLFSKLQASKPAIENKVRTAPKIVKPGQAQPEGVNAKLRDLKQSVSKSGGKNGTLAAYLIAAGKV